MGFPAAYYTTSVLEEGVVRADLLLGPDWRGGAAALCLLSYVLEVDTGFTFGAVYDGIGQVMQERGRAAWEEEEEEEAKGEEEEEEEDDEDEDEEDVAPSLKQPRRSFLCPPAPLQLLSSTFSTSSHHWAPEEEGRKRRSRMRVKVTKVGEEASGMGEELRRMKVKPGQVKVWQPQSPLTKLKVGLHPAPRHLTTCTSPLAPRHLTTCTSPPRHCCSDCTTTTTTWVVHLTTRCG